MLAEFRLAITAVVRRLSDDFTLKFVGDRSYAQKIINFKAKMGDARHFVGRMSWIVIQILHGVSNQQLDYLPGRIAQQEAFASALAFCAGYCREIQQAVKKLERRDRVIGGDPKPKMVQHAAVCGCIHGYEV